MKEYFKPNLAYRKTYWKHWTSLPAEIYEWIRCFIQRGKQGYCYRDIWSIDCYLVEIIPPMIKRLKETTYGFPADLTEEKWIEILDKIILGFEAGKKIVDDANWVMNEGSDMIFVASEEHPNLKSIEFTNPWTEDQIKHFRELDAQDRKNFDEGIELFHKYFFSLWD